MINRLTCEQPVKGAIFFPLSKEVLERISVLLYRGRSNPAAQRKITTVSKGSHQKKKGEEEESGRQKFHLVCPVFFLFFFLFAPLIYPALPKAARRAAGIMRCCNEDPAYRPIGINRVHVQTNTPAFRSPRFSFQRGPPVR